MLFVCVLLHCLQICAERKFRKIKRTYLHSLYSCTTWNVTMCFNSFEWRAREVCLLQNNFERTLINKQLERVNNTSLCKKKKLRKVPSLQYDNMHQFSGRHEWAGLLCCDWFGIVRYGNSPIDPKIANQTAALEWCRSTVHLMILVFIYSKIDINLFTYCFFKAYILLMDQRSLRS